MNVSLHSSRPLRLAIAMMLPAPAVYAAATGAGKTETKVNVLVISSYYHVLTTGKPENAVQ